MKKQFHEQYSEAWIKSIRMYQFWVHLASNCRLMMEAGVHLGVLKVVALQLAPA